MATADMRVEDDHPMESEQEMEADCFARLLLMDEKAFRTAFADLKEAASNRPDLVIKLLAEVFCVPKKQVVIRIRELYLPLL